MTISTLFARVGSALEAASKADATVAQDAFAAILACSVFKQVTPSKARDLLIAELKLDASPSSISRAYRVALAKAEDFRGQCPVITDETAVCDAATAFAATVNVRTEADTLSQGAVAKAEVRRKETAKAVKKAAKAAGASVPMHTRAERVEKLLSEMEAAAKEGDMTAAAAVARIQTLANATGERIAAHYAEKAAKKAAKKAA